MPNFTRKHYETLAQVIDAERHLFVVGGDSHYTRGPASLERLATHLADVFVADNPQFDRMRFLEACGFPNAHKED